MTQSDLYTLLASGILSEEDFKFDEETKTVSIQVPLKPTDIQGFTEEIQRIFASDPMNARSRVIPSETPIVDTYKFNSQYIDVDKRTVGINKFGEICVLPEAIITDILSSDETQEGLNELARHAVAEAVEQSFTLFRDEIVGMLNTSIADLKTWATEKFAPNEG
jgi:hypothetical protein